jgi:acetyl-CoA synthetase
MDKQERQGRTLTASPLTYDEALNGFEWRIPEYFNIGVDVCDRWAAIDPNRCAIVELDSNRIRETSFEALRRRSNRIANLLKSFGLRQGDRVGVLASQGVDTAAIHIAIYKSGAIAVPLFLLFGADALLHRLADSEARFLFADTSAMSQIGAISAQLPDLTHIIQIGAPAEPIGLESLLDSMADAFEPVRTRADDPALIIYTSGTTGPSKGALHAHRVLLGHLPGVEMSHDGFPQPGDRIWTPADWAWIGGLLDVLLPALHHGVGVVAYRLPKFDAEEAFDLISRCGVRNLFLPPTALKMMRLVENPVERWRLQIRTVASGGETLGGDLIEWGRRVLGVTINEFYGQTECNMVLSSCARWFEPQIGAIGRPVPGHRVAIVGSEGETIATGEEGDIAVAWPDPVMFLGYWRQPEATLQKFCGDWLVTGDRGCMDADGFVRFLGRSDDVITTAGYRIGPGEIEDCILKHPAVAAVGVVGIPDPARTEVVAAVVVPRDSRQDTGKLAEEIQEWVRTRLGAHQYPRIVRFIDALPLTVTGKVMRRRLRELLTSGP